MDHSVHQTIVLIPAHNEASIISSVIQSCLRTGVDMVIVVDDGSTDDTGPQAQAAGADVLRHCINCGKGAAIRTGIQYIISRGYVSSHRFVVLMDADGQHDPHHIGRLIEPLTKGSDVTLGVRHLTPDTPVKNRLGRRVGDILTQLYTGHVFRDSQCGYRALTIDSLAQMSFHAKKYDFESELLWQIRHHHLRYTYVQIESIYTAYSTHKKNKQGLVNGLKTVLSLIR